MPCSRRQKPLRSGNPFLQFALQTIDFTKNRMRVDRQAAADGGGSMVARDELGRNQAPGLFHPLFGWISAKRNLRRAVFSQQHFGQAKAPI